MRRRLYAFALLAALSIAQAQTENQTPAPAVRHIGTTRLENVPEIPAHASAAVQRYQNDRAAVFEDWLADGSMLIATRFCASQQIHRVTAPGGARKNGVEAWCVVFADEGHGFLKKHNNDLRREVETVFLARLFGAGPRE